VKINFTESIANSYYVRHSGYSASAKRQRQTELHGFRLFWPCVTVVSVHGAQILDVIRGVEFDRYAAAAATPLPSFTG
jgi:hypothetical protein